MNWIQAAKSAQKNSNQAHDMANIPLSEKQVYRNEYDMITAWSNYCLDVKFDPPVLQLLSVFGFIH